MVPLLQQRAHVVDDVRAAGFPHNGGYRVSEGGLRWDAGVLRSGPEDREDGALPGCCRSGQQLHFASRPQESVIGARQRRVFAKLASGTIMLDSISTSHRFY